MKEKVKVKFLHSAAYMVDQEQCALTTSEVAVDFQEPMVLHRKCDHPLPALTDIGPAVAASKHTTAPINHARPSPCTHSSDVTTPSEMAKPDYCLLLIYPPRKDERLSWPSWLTCSRWLTHKWLPSSYRSSTGHGSSRPQDRRSTSIPRNQVQADVVVSLQNKKKYLHGWSIANELQMRSILMKQAGLVACFCNTHIAAKKRSLYKVQTITYSC